MAYELKEGQGTLFKNEHKTQDKHPSYKGTIKIDGQIKDIALWKRTSGNGKTYLSVVISEHKQAQQTQQPEEPQDTFGDSIPF